jgi:serine/threonine protein kinase/tetratricopeptide (TPR) repeat protein
MISPDRIEQIFWNALQLTSEAERSAYLESACGADDELRRLVEKLLRAQPRAAAFLEQPFSGPYTTIHEPILESPGAVIGLYKLLEKIGEGGFGVVFMAEQQEPIRRKVALKVLKPGMDTRQVVARFEAERQALALMDHSNIARVLDAGQTSTGRPYFVMDLIKGLPITTYCDQAQLSARERLRLFHDVCAAVQHAHQKGIIHRDIKPSNVLVTMQDGSPLVKVIDFGIAKAMGRQLSEKTLFTGFAQIIGTPLYMSPEQAALSNVDVDTRSDIYSMGVLLYELLTGTTPFKEERLREVGYDEWRRIIQEEQPPRPSTRLSTLGLAATTVAAQRKCDARRLSQLCRGELDWIVMKCLEKDRGRRYETASALALDIQRYLADEPVVAGPPSAAYRVKKFVKRHKGQVLAAVMVLLVLLGGIAGTTWGLVRAVRARESEAEQRQEAEKQKERAQQAEKETLEDYRANTDEAIEQLIGSRPGVGPQEKSYLEKTLKRWQAFAARKGDDERSRAIRGEAQFCVAYLRHKLGQREEAAAGYQKALTLWQKLADEFPAVPEYRQHLASSHINLGNVLAGQSQPDKAAEQYRKALAIFQKLADDFPAVPQYRRELASSHNNLGQLLAGQSQPDKAAHHHHQALAIRQRLADELPAVPEYRQYLARSHNNLANLLVGQNQPDKAAEQYRKALAIQQKLAVEFPAVPECRQELARSHNNLGLLLAHQKQPDKAAEQYRKAMAIFQKLADEFPAVPQYRRELASSHGNLGNVLAGQNQPDEAAEQHREALAIFQKLADYFPAVPEYRQHLASTHNNLANLLASQNQPDKAAEQYRKALAIQQKLVEEFPADPVYRQHLARSHHNLANLLKGQNQPDKAAEHFRKALPIRQKLADDFPAATSYQVELGGCCCDYGILLRETGKVADSLEWFDMAISTLTRIHQKAPRVVTPRQFLRNSHGGRAMAHAKLDQHAEAVKDWARVIELSPPPEQPYYRARRADSRVRAGQVVEAVTEVTELRKSSTVSASGWYDFACIYALASTKAADKKQEYTDQAMRMLRHAVQSGYKDTAHIAKDRDLDALRDRGDFKELLVELEAKKK